MSDAAEAWVCPACGPNAAADEDGLCTSCGATCGTAGQLRSWLGVTHLTKANPTEIEIAYLKGKIDERAEWEGVYDKGFEDGYASAQAKFEVGTTLAFDATQKLQAALREAVKHLQKHNNEYHHATPPELIDAFVQLTGDTP